MKPTWSLRRLSTVDDSQIDALADVLIDCVEGGASVSFMLPLTRDRAVAFWRRVANSVAVSERVLLVAEDQYGICGTVQLIFDMPENQPHRADLAKMLVHRRARRQGLGAVLMHAAEDTARQCGKTLLVLDAVTNGDAARLYERLGWVRVGDVPNFALMPRGEPCSTTYYYRNLLTPSKSETSVKLMTDNVLLSAFEDCSLPFEQWTHQAHVRTAFLYASRHDLKSAIDRMREGIKKYNLATNTPDAIDRGYHETITQAFMRLIFMANLTTGPHHSSKEFCEAHPELLSKSALRTFYSPERIMTWEAKALFVDPDLCPLPSTMESESIRTDIRVEGTTPGLQLSPANDNEESA